MNEIVPVLNQIIMLMLLLGIGWMLRRMRVFSEPVIKGMNMLVMTVTWPALMISSTQREYTQGALNDFLVILLGSIALLAVGCLALFWVFSRTGRDRRAGRDAAPVMAMLCAMPNAGFFGIPIIDALYGPTGLLLLTAYILGFNIVLWTVAVSMFTGFSAKSLRHLLNPGIICAIIGLALFVLRIALPDALGSAANQLAAVNTPLSMLILGARMDSLRPRDLADARLWLCVAIKLLVFPLAALFPLYALGLRGMTLVLMVVITAMPAAAACQMLTERYGGDVYFSAKTTSVCTVCTLLTIPLILYVAKLFA